MSRTKKDVSLENMFALVRDILSDRSIETIVCEDKHNALRVSRHVSGSGQTNAIGFTDDNGADYSEDEEEEDK